MFHVKQGFCKSLLMKISLSLLLTIISQTIYSQKEKEFKIGLGSDLCLGSEYNNFATSARITYNILDRFRVVPAYAVYLKKEKKNMNTISFDFNYLIPNVSKKAFPKSSEEIFFIYPTVGFFILNYSNSENIRCDECSTMPSYNGKNFDSNFGFNFGAGAEWKLPSSSKFLKKSSLFLEMKYVTVEKYTRLLFSSGLLYKL